jgi:hypothetical protein
MISYSGIYKDITDAKIRKNKLNSPQSLDEFDINIIDLRDGNIWVCNANNNKSINCINDFVNLNIMISKCKKTKIIYMFPSDIGFSYYRNTSNGGFYFNTNIKDVMSIIQGDILSKLNSDFSKIKIYYENTKTNIANKDIAASFYFDDNETAVLTKSIGSDKATTVKINTRTLTSLQLSTENDIYNFLKQIGLIEDRIDIPEWISQYDFFDDSIQKEIINDNGEIIVKAKNNIELANAVLDRNNEFKSILYTNGDLLVKVIFSMLGELLEYDMSKVIDEKKEDFLIKKDNITFIGEIKGVTSNVRSEHVSQLDNHFQGYKDKLADEGRVENIKSILIINHQRNSDINQRQPIHEIQIELAKRNGSLIIETLTLLKLYEKFRIGNLSTSTFHNRLETEIGLMTSE